MKKIMNIITIYSLYIASLASLGPSTALALETVPSTQELASTNLEENKEDQKEDVEIGEGISKDCGVNNDSTESRLEAENDYNNRVTNLNFDKQNGLFKDIKNAGGLLNVSVDVMATSSENIVSANQAAQNLSSLGEEDKAKLKEFGDKLKVLIEEASEISVEISKIVASCGNDSKCRKDKEGEVNAKSAEANIIDNKIKKLGMESNNTVIGSSAAQEQEDLNQGGAAGASQNTATSDATTGRIDDANAKGHIVEKKMADLRQSIADGVEDVDKLLARSMERLEDVMLENKNNSEYEMFELAKGPINEDYSLNSTADKMTLSNLEVMSTTTSAINLLKCEDISESQSRSYPLFRAAAATYIASLINDTSDHLEDGGSCLLKCVSLDDIVKDRIKSPESREYKELNLKAINDIDANCKTANAVGSSNNGVYINDNNAGDDKNEQIKSFERVLDLQKTMVEAFKVKLENTGVDIDEIERTNIGAEKKEDAKVEVTTTPTKNGALSMFKAAHAAALNEITTRQELVSAAESQLKRAENWEDESSSMIQMFAGIVGLYTGYQTFTCAQATNVGQAAVFAPQCIAWGVATLAMIAVLIFWKGDNEKAKEDVKKWEGELAKARLHGLMKCNYPGHVGEISAMDKPESVKLIYDLGVIEPLVANVYQTPINMEQSIWRSYAQILSPKAKAFQEFLFKMANATTNEDFSKSLGLNQDSGGFRSYMRMRLGAWILSTSNAAKDVDLKPASIDISKLHPPMPDNSKLYGQGYIQNNNTEFNGKKIQRVGFPLPETRAAYIELVVDMIEHNIKLNENGLASAEINLDIYRRLVNKNRKVFDLDTTGHEDDESKEEKKDATCMKNVSGFMQVDKACECQKSNSCYSFKSLEYADFQLDPIRANSELTLEKANALNGGKLEKVELIDAKLDATKNAVSDVLYKRTVKLFGKKTADEKNKGTAFFDNLNGNLNSKSKSKKALGSSSSKTGTNGGSFLGGNSANGVVNNFLLDPNADKNRKAYLKNAAQRRKNLQDRLKSLHGGGGKGGAGFDPYSFTKPTHKTGTDYANSDAYKFKNKVGKEEAKVKDNHANYYDNFKVTSRNSLDGEQIYEDSSLSLFKIISKRYKKASPRFESIK